MSTLFSSRGKAFAQTAEIFGDEVIASLKSALPNFPSKWVVLPIVTQKLPLVSQIAESLCLPLDTAASDILTALEEKCAKECVLLVLDELGRGLEAIAEGRGDAHFLQDLAEVASRSNGRLIVVGILHQAFEDYADGLGQRVKDDWSKIQGRFIDISVSVTAEEAIGLIADAMADGGKSKGSKRVSEKTVELFHPEPTGDERDALVERLSRVAPLHPTTAAMLAPVSRRRFGQNQRSVFSFLNSAEPFGLQDIRSGRSAGISYHLDRLWDYLRANYEAAILSSPDGRRWTLGSDCVDRASARGANEVSVRVLKVIAVFHLLQGRAPLRPDEATIATCLSDCVQQDVETALAALVKGSEIVFRRHTGLYLPYAGSDFDISANLNSVLAEMGEPDLDAMARLAEIPAMLAKRHQINTGAPRWFHIVLTYPRNLGISSDPLLDTAGEISGRLVVVLPDRSESPQTVKSLAEASSLVRTHDARVNIIGIHMGALELVAMARELEALSLFEDRFPELAGDAIAKRELEARRGELRQILEQRFSQILEECIWFANGQELGMLDRRGLNDALSHLMDERFPQSPVLLNELLNCSEPSSNAVSARTKLMKRMVRRGSEANLGFSGKSYPAERGLFESLLKDADLHVGDGFHAPTAGNPLAPLWAVADAVMNRYDGPVSSGDVLDAWAKPPIGLKAGLAPVYLVAYIESRRDRIAVYCDGVFQSAMNELGIEYLARDPSEVSLRRVDMTGLIGETLTELGTIIGTGSDARPLGVARQIVGDFDALVPWTKRTQTLSAKALALREILKRANDPNKLLFDDLPMLAADGSDEPLDPVNIAVVLRELLAEMRAAYPAIMDDLTELLLRELNVRGRDAKAYEMLRMRAENIRQISGDLRLEAFVGRLSQFFGTREDMEGLASVAADRLARDWNDRDQEKARVGIADLSAQFLKTETLAHVKGRKDKRHALALIVGREQEAAPVVGEFQVADEDRHEIETLAAAINNALHTGIELRREVVLAALAEVTSRYLVEANIDSKRKKA
ncbi:hypothetical protein [Erythrobacter crassostreae]|uniref:ATP-binding protein n=1 Tax=Erythrobacter crassostreae TaxID=2828328 RepID=A0A9X1F4J2_9SPHN|nr:hypothetical protein [Erythrobacter crassostrea]MBV7259363.1 hypothetical protein [Erythrobacter crassostrea]